MPSLIESSIDTAKPRDLAVKLELGQAALLGEAVLTVSESFIAQDASRIEGRLPCYSKIYPEGGTSSSQPGPVGGRPTSTGSHRRTNPTEPRRRGRPCCPIARRGASVYTPPTLERSALLEAFGD